MSQNRMEFEMGMVTYICMKFGDNAVLHENKERQLLRKLRYVYSRVYSYRGYWL